ncbi:hypothetical protein EDB85DRAFT_1402900 [Lactarius pseudohatsudake]|nr:hypothetical protein EDB85DRAFT_1402900 [Lactarius pseudohatsudake]
MSVPAPTSAPIDQAMDMPTPNPFRQSGTPSSQASSSQGSSWGNQGPQVSLSNIWGHDSQFTDESSHLFSLYLSYAEKHDKEQTDSWKAGADGILVFTGLFAAALATFVIDSYKSLLPDTGSNTVAILTQISQQLSNGSQTSAQAYVAPSSPFKPSTSAVWVNALWFLSLVISLFCALLATLQQHWARRYLRLTQPQCAVHKRARLRSFFAEGVERFHLAFAVEAIPALLHISVFLFLTGLVISLFTIHHTIAYIILAATVTGGIVYTMITVMPVFCHNSPYHSPFSTLVWNVPRKIAKTLLSAAHHIGHSLQKYTGFVRADSISSLSTKILEYKKRLSVSMDKAAEDTADKQHWSIDARALSWTLNKSDEESELEKFIAGIPRFTRSKAVEDPMGVLKAATTGSSLRPSLYRDITNLFINASDPGLLPTYKELSAGAQQRRIGICLVALYVLPQAIEKLLRRVSKELGNPKVKRGFVSLLETTPSWDMALKFSEIKTRYRKQNERFENVVIGARCMAAVIATRLPNTMSHSILTRQLGVRDPDAMHRYIESSDSLLLKNLNHFLANTALRFIHVEGTDLLLSTVRIIKRLQLSSAAHELRVEFERYFRTIARHVVDPNSSAIVRKNAKDLLLELVSLRNSAPVPPALTDAPTAMPPDNGGLVSTADPTQFPLPQVSSSPTGDAIISMQPYPEKPSGESHPLMPTPSPRIYPESPHSAAPLMMPVPSRDISSGDGESVE